VPHRRRQPALARDARAAERGVTPGRLAQVLGVGEHVAQVVG
jgi:hypothetical protein